MCVQACRLLQSFRNFQPPGNQLTSELFPVTSFQNLFHFEQILITSKRKPIKLSRIFFHLWVNFDVMNFPTQNQNHELSERIFNCRRRMKVKRTLNSYFVFIFTDKIRSSFLVILFESHNSMKTKRTFTVVVKFSPPPEFHRTFLNGSPLAALLPNEFLGRVKCREGD